eukprot:1133552-Pelagomonas_calceolata.AAC.3
MQTGKKRKPQGQTKPSHPKKPRTEGTQKKSPHGQQRRGAAFGGVASHSGSKDDDEADEHPSSPLPAKMVKGGDQNLVAMSLLKDSVDRNSSLLKKVRGSSSNKLHFRVVIMPHSDTHT